jgi:predicted GH43/DUF377 family glycosyl hydrolase
MYVMWYGGDDGSTFRTGRATSPDGIVWAKDSLNPVLTAGQPWEWDRSGAWEARVISANNQYSMWFTGANGRFGPGTTWNIGQASSTDGRTWRKATQNPLLREGDAGSWEAFYTNSPTVVYDGTTYHLWYESHRGSWSLAPETGIGYARSMDGIHWTKEQRNPVLGPGPPGSWDGLGVSFPYVVHESGRFHMWYAGNKRMDLSEGSGLGYAVSVDGITWKKYPGNPILLGSPGSWDSKVFMPCVVLKDTVFQMWYSGRSDDEGNMGSIGFATAPRNPATIAIEPTSIDFHNVHPLATSDTIRIRVSNWGFTPLVILSVAARHPEFTVTDPLALPLTVLPFEGMEAGVIFRPSLPGVAVLDTLTIISNDLRRPSVLIPLRGRGSGPVVPVQNEKVYGIAASPPGTLRVFEIDRSTGAANPFDLLSPDAPPDMVGLSIRPSDRTLYGVRTSSSHTQLYRISSAFGDVEPAGQFLVGGVSAFTFGPGDVAYLADTAGRLFRSSAARIETLLTEPVGRVLTGLAVSPATGTLWASGLDSLYRLDTTARRVVLVGHSGFPGRSSIAFSSLGVLYGLFGEWLVTVNKITGTADLIGSTGVPEMKGIALHDVITEVGGPPEPVVRRWRLEQNFPNPFNGSSDIGFSLAEPVRVRLGVYDLLGRELVVLVDETLPRGRHSVRWNASGFPSGTYVYRFAAGSFIQAKTMLLIR